jgi:phospholipase A-2-activating protein
VVDLARLVIGYCPDAYSEPSYRPQFFRSLFDAADWTDSWRPPLPKQQNMNILLLMRGLANAFQDNTSLGDGVWAREVRRKLCTLLKDVMLIIGLAPRRS